MGYLICRLTLFIQILAIVLATATNSGPQVLQWESHASARKGWPYRSGPRPHRNTVRMPEAQY